MTPNARYDHILGFAVSHPWAIEPAMLHVIATVIARHVAGVDVERSEIEAALVNRKNLPQPRVGSAAIIPVYGVLAPRMNLLSEFSGGTTYEKLTGQLREAMANADVKTIVFDIDSPGGSVAGNAELATEIMRARAKKPIIAVAQYTAGSAAYQLAAAATEIVAAPSARVGSIGTYAIHDDLSDALKQLGVKRTFISAGAGKVDGNETEPLGAEARARIEASVNEAYGMFVSNVVKGRGKGMTADRVRNEWKAHVYSAADALALGMIDRVATLDDTLARVLTGSGSSDDARAARAFLTEPATDQEPIAATSQERISDADLERQIFELSL